MRKQTNIVGASMKYITKQELSDAFSKIGIKDGDIVFYQTDLRVLGLPKGINLKDKDAFCKFYFDAITDVIGSDGTLVIFTASTQVGRYDLEFDVQKTESNYGSMANYALSLPDITRSTHPLISYAAIGKMKDEICRQSSTSNYGGRSPMAQMVKYGTKNLFVGIQPEYSTNLMHYIEHVCGVPYIYNKLLKYKPINHGKVINKDYTAIVRYVEYNVQSDSHAFCEKLREQGLINTTRLNDESIAVANMKEAFEVGIDMLEENIYAFLKEPPKFEYGKIPFDGPTAKREKEVYGEEVSISKMAQERKKL